MENVKKGQEHSVMQWKVCFVNSRCGGTKYTLQRVERQKGDGRKVEEKGRKDKSDKTYIALYKMYIIQYTVDNTQNTFKGHSVKFTKYTWYSVQKYRLYSIHYTVYSIQRALETRHERAKGSKHTLYNISSMRYTQ